MSKTRSKYVQQAVKYNTWSKALKEPHKSLPAYAKAMWHDPKGYQEASAAGIKRKINGTPGGQHKANSLRSRVKNDPSLIHGFRVSEPQESLALSPEAKRMLA